MRLFQKGLLFHKILKLEQSRKRLENYGRYFEGTRSNSSKRSTSGNYNSI